MRGVGVDGRLLKPMPMPMPKPKPSRRARAMSVVGRRRDVAVMYGDVSASWDDLPEDEDEDEEYEYDAAEAATDASEDASATMAVDVMASPESVWRCLSRGENLSEFVPTLLVAKRGPKSYGSTETEVRLLAMDYTLFTPRMLNTVSVRIVDRSTGPPSWQNGPATLGFVARNVDDRSEFSLSGSFCISPIFGESYKCRVEYRAELKPLRYAVPVKILQRAVEESLPFVIASVTKQAVKRDQQRLRAPQFLPQLETPFGANAAVKQREEETLMPGSYLGLSEVNVPIPNPSSSQDDEDDSAASAASTVHMRPRGEKQNAKQTGAPTSWRAIGGGATPGKKWFSSDITPFQLPGSLEVHMRRYDTDSLLHRRALGAVRVEAPPALVWELLTNFDNMPMFVPHLVHTEFIQRYASEPVRKDAAEVTKRMRLRHVFLKCELFHMVEESTALDLVQKDDKGELQFRVLQNPRFGALQGKWLVVPADDDAKATVLKFAIEGVVKSQGNDVPSRKIDPLKERIAFEEISTMLKLARDFMESVANKKVKSYGSVDINVADLVLKGEQRSMDEDAIIKGEMSISSTRRQRSQDEIQDDVAELKSELVQLGFGRNKVMPSRKELRKGRHWDVIKRIEGLGGFVEVAKRLDWESLQKRPRGYWNLRTLELEISDFIANSDDPQVYTNPRVMPSQRALRDGGRADIVNALKRFGGAVKVAESINFEVNEERLKAATRPNARDR